VFDELLRGFFMRPLRLEGQQDVQIKLDVSENDKAYTVHAEIPGVRKENIHVTIDGSQIAITAEVKNEKEMKEGEKLLCSERYFGKAARAFTVDEEASQAKYNDGVLELILPKKAAAASKRLEIH
jgi:HSP20 family protein